MRRLLSALGSRPARPEPSPSPGVRREAAPPEHRGLVHVFHQTADVPGWSLLDDAIVLEALSRVQIEQGVRGDILEIGCFVGRSAILLAHLCQGDERLIVCDPFEDEPSDRDNADENALYYEGLRRADFEANFLRHHAQLPMILQCVSSALRPEDFARRLRFVHVDGSHEYAAVTADIELARRILAPDGIVALDDYMRPHTPGVGAAVWEAVATGGLRPVCLTDSKLYGTWSSSADGLTERSIQAIRDDGVLRIRMHSIAGRSVPRFTSAVP